MTPFHEFSQCIFNSNEKGPKFGLHCKYQLLQFKPWHTTQDNAWDDQPATKEIYIAKWKKFLEQVCASICSLQEKNQVDLGPNYRNPKACKTFVSHTEQDVIKNELQRARFFSALAGESTDSGIIEQESVFVRYVGPGG